MDTILKLDSLDFIIFHIVAKLANTSDFGTSVFTLVIFLSCIAGFYLCQNACTLGCQFIVFLLHYIFIVADVSCKVDFNILLFGVHCLSVTFLLFFSSSFSLFIASGPFAVRFIFPDLLFDFVDIVFSLAFLATRGRLRTVFLVALLPTGAVVGRVFGITGISSGSRLRV